MIEDSETIIKEARKNHSQGILRFGIFIFKEVNFKQHWLRLSAGVVMAIGACVLLFFAM